MFNIEAFDDELSYLPPSSLTLLQRLIDDEVWRLYETPMDELDPVLLERLHGSQCGEDMLFRIRKYVLDSA